MQALIRTDEGLGRRRRNRLSSYITVASRLLGAEPADIPCDPKTIRERFRQTHHVHAGIGRHYFSNIQGNLSYALKHTGIWMLRRSKTPLSPPWRELRELLPEKHLRPTLSRFLRFCDETGVVPEQVNDATATAFKTAMMERSFVSNPEVVHRRTCGHWNQAVATIPGWPQVRLTVQSERWPSRRLPWESLPESFRNDVERYLRWLGGDETVCERPVSTPRRPTTIKTIRGNIHCLVVVLADAGYDPQNLTSLSDIVTVDRVKAVLRHRIEAQGGKVVLRDRAIVCALIRIACDWIGVDRHHFEALHGIRRRLGPRRVGLAEQNLGAVRQFGSDRNKALLLRLPDDLLDEALQGEKGDVAAAITAQSAVAIELVLATPIVFERLITLRLDLHLSRRDGTLYLTIPANWTRRDSEQTFMLGEHTRHILDTYLSQFRPRFERMDSPWIFPAIARDRVPTVTLRQRVNKAILRHTGLRIGPHQFRYIAAKIILDAEPGAYELVRQFLGHRQIVTTMNFCRGMETRSALQRYDAILSRLRGDPNSTEEGTGDVGNATTP